MKVLTIIEIACWVWIAILPLKTMAIVAIGKSGMTIVQKALVRAAEKESGYPYWLLVIITEVNSYNGLMWLACVAFLLMKYEIIIL